MVTYSKFVLMFGCGFCGLGGGGVQVGSYSDCSLEFRKRSEKDGHKNSYTGPAPSALPVPRIYVGMEKNVARRSWREAK